MPALRRGFVRTARGEILNFGELVAKSTRPRTQTDVDMKNTVQKRTVRQPVNVRGFMPLAGNPPPEMPKEKVQSVKKSLPTLAEMTAITIKRKSGKAEGLVAATNEGLAEIMSELDNPKVSKED